MDLSYRFERICLRNPDYVQTSFWSSRSQTSDSKTCQLFSWRWPSISVLPLWFPQSTSSSWQCIDQGTCRRHLLRLPSCASSISSLLSSRRVSGEYCLRAALSLIWSVARVTWPLTGKASSRDWTVDWRNLSRVVWTSCLQLTSCSDCVRSLTKKCIWLFSFAELNNQFRFDSRRPSSQKATAQPSLHLYSSHQVKRFWEY